MNFKHFLFLTTGLFFSIQLFSQSGDLTSSTDEFLSSVVSDGLVDYTIINNQPNTLNNLVSKFEQMDLNSMSSEEKKSALINAYNIMAIKQIIDNHPITSPLSISGFYKSKEFNIGGNLWTLDFLENEILRKEYMDARIHFALVCGALGCPRIYERAFDHTKLDQQLDARTSLALNSSWFVYQDGSNTIQLSQIFDWFTDDFGGKNNLITWINMFRSEKFPVDAKIGYYDYNWNLNTKGATNPVAHTGTAAPREEFNLQTFTGGSLLKQGQLDLTLFNTIYTQSKSKWKGETFTGSRQSFYTHALQATYGISKNGRFNIGLEANFKASANSSDSTASSVTAPLDYANTDSTRVGLSNIGLRLKIQPFKDVSNFSIQTTFSIPTIEHPEGFSDQDNPTNNRYFIDWNRYIWWNQFFYDNSFGDFQIFTSLETLFRFGKEKGHTSAVDLPVKAFISYFPTNKITIYAMTEHVPRFRYDTELSPESLKDNITTSGNYTASGAGFKYQVGSRFNIELLYTNFWRSKNAGLGNTFNIGLKYITGR